MSKPRIFVLMVGFAAVLVAGAAAGLQREKPREEPTKKVLVEFYTSQGCDSCPAAGEVLGRLEELGYGPENVVVLAFHVDYFNEPWQDPYSRNEFSAREWSYNKVMGREDLYFTPMMMIDGRYPMLGSDQRKALAALKLAGQQKPGVSLDLELTRANGQATLKVKLASAATNVSGRDLLVGVAITEDPVTTDVLSGENKGKRLVEHAVVRGFVHKMVRLEAPKSESLSFPLELAQNANPKQSRVSVFVQDRAKGKVYQAESIPWEAVERNASKIEGSTARTRSAPASKIEAKPRTRQPK